MSKGFDRAVADPAGGRDGAGDPADDGLLAARSPFPEGIPERLREQFAFLIEADKLKTIVRQSPLAAAPRRENDAEHSWHLALMVPVLAEYADEPIDVGHTVKLVVVHDLIEIYAGDTPLFDESGGRESKQRRESAAADRLFPLLPADQAADFRSLWDEFEARKTPEARFAKSVDGLQPMLLNWMAEGGTWRTSGTDAGVVRARKSVIGVGSAPLWSAARALIDEAERRGWVAPPEAAPGPQAG